MSEADQALARIRAWRGFAETNQPGKDHLRDVSYEQYPVGDGDIDAILDRLAELEELGVERHAEMLVERVRLRSLEFRNGGLTMDLAEAREHAAIYVACARTMLGGAENYSETPVEFHVKVAEQPELYILTVQRTEPHKLTPHQARRRAEEERDRALARAVELEARIVELEADRGTKPQWGIGLGDVESGDFCVLTFYTEADARRDAGDYEHGHPVYRYPGRWHVADALEEGTPQ